MISKRAAIGEGIFTLLVRLSVLAAIAFIIFGVAASFYNPYVDVRDAEARIMTRQLNDCLAPKGAVDVGGFSEENKLGLLVYCHTGGIDSERFFVRAKVTQGNKEIIRLEQGDSGALWVKDIFNKAEFETEGFIERYSPGYYTKSYPVRITNKEVSIGSGEINFEVLVKNE